MLTFSFVWRLECAGLKITKQHEAVACKLWMRSRSANTAQSEIRGDFVLDSPLVVSYLFCSVLFADSASSCRLSKQPERLSLWTVEKVKAMKNNVKRTAWSSDWAGIGFSMYDKLWVQTDTLFKYYVIASRDNKLLLQRILSSVSN